MKINLDKENPLKTILKAGKIPVIRRSNEGFKNYNQKAFFDNHRDCCDKEGIDYDNISGCFCLIGGIHGNWVTGSHFKEKLNIGYIEPDTMVFATITLHDKDSYTFMTAKQRYEEMLHSYTKDFLFEEKRGYDYDIEDFELEEEIIVDAKKIKKVCEVEFQDFYKFFKWDDAGVLRIFEEDCLFNLALNEKLHMDFIHNLGYESESELWEDYDNFSRYEGLTDRIIDLFKLYLFGNITEDDYADVRTYIQNVKEFKTKYSITKVYNYKRYISVEFTNDLPKDVKSITISYRIDLRELKLVEHKTNRDIMFSNLYAKMSYDEYVRASTITTEYTNEQCLNSIYLKYLTEFYAILNDYKQLFKGYIRVSNNNALAHFDKVYKIVKTLETNELDFVFSKDLTVVYINYSDMVSVEYNICLKDFVINVNNIDYYNMDKLPKEYKGVQEIVDLVA